MYHAGSETGTCHNGEHDYCDWNKENSEREDEDNANRQKSRAEKQELCGLTGRTRVPQPEHGSEQRRKYHSNYERVRHWYGPSPAFYNDQKYTGAGLKTRPYTYLF